MQRNDVQDVLIEPDVEQLREEIEHLEQAGGEVADALAEKEQENSFLRAEIEQLRSDPAYPLIIKRDGDWPSHWMLQPFALTWLLAGLVFAEWLMIRQWGIHFPSPAWQLACVSLRSVTQLTFLAWTLAVWRTEGVEPLFSKLSWWAAGWAIAVIWIGHLYEFNSDLLYWGLKMTMLSNWWGQLYFSDRLRDFGIGLFVLTVTADTIADFKLMRWLIRFYQRRTA